MLRERLSVAPAPSSTVCGPSRDWNSVNGVDLFLACMELADTDLDDAGCLACQYRTRGDIVLSLTRRARFFANFGHRIQ